MAPNVVFGMELDTPMTGLDPGGDVQFKPAACTVAEIIRYPDGKCSDYTHKMLQQGQLEEWVEERARANLPAIPNTVGEFACTAPTALDSEGNYASSSETLELAMSQETFTSLAQRYQFSGCLDAWRYRATSGSASRKIEYDDAGEITSSNFTLSMRLSGSFASILSINHTFITNTSTILALRVSPYDQRLLQRTLEQHNNLIGHALLIPTILIKLSLASNMLFMQKIRHELSVVEKATGQHAWLQIPAADAPAHDSELSRLGHAAKIDVLVSYRRIEALSCFLELVKESARQFEEVIGKAFVGSSSRGPRDAYIQWVGDLEQLVKFRMVDLKYSERRADNQLTAIYGLLAQRDNMVGVSVAIESKKISEASKRDGSALKSLTVLTAVFFPATYIATLFSLPTFDNTPFWLYWVVVVPLTLIIFGSWSCWTLYRQRQIARETIRRDIDQDVKLDPERAVLPSSLQGGSGMASTGATSFLASTVRQIRSHTKGLNSQGEGVDGGVNVVKISELVGRKNGS
ncbi:hypothetical protein BJX68DRAFT_271581 [Aspergillus pseudodeflectus]|uniref:Uncharacterized protein n=1 Tax=Aspergillus pseudodeflectus TaxID=176178 RepID=A0ABR4JLI6_9EURO